MATLFLPWNHRPSNTSARRTGSYTVPAGKYARVVFQNNSTDCSIDGATVIPQNQYESSGAGSQTVVADFICHVRYHLNASGGSNALGTGSAQVNAGGKVASVSAASSSSSASSNSLSGVIVAYGGDTVTVTTNATGVGSASGSAELDYFTPAQKEYWVDAGTVLDGGAYYVEEYDVP